MTDKGQTICQSPAVAGALAAEKRAEGYTVSIIAKGSDDKRGTRPHFIVTWAR